MVAKGHDFPDVDLGVVLDADATLRFPDFRAEERTFALVAPLAGRAGRAEHSRPPGARPDPRARCAVDRARRAATTPRTFLAAELGRREALRYPPFSTLIRVVCSSPAPGAAHAAATAVRAGLGVDRDTALGPAPLFRLRGRERSQVVVKAGDRAPAVAAVGGVVDRLAGDRGHRQVAFSVDVDPQ